MTHEMQERPTSQNAKRPNYVRAGSKDSMEVKYLTSNVLLINKSIITKAFKMYAPLCSPND